MVAPGWVPKNLLAQLCTVAAVAAAAAAAAEQKPHIVFAVIDDHGYHDLGYAGSRIKTPTIDKFAMEGVRFTQAYVQKVCSPTRTAILTGRYPHRMGMQTPFCLGTAQGLNLNETLMSQYLNDVGYVSHAVGKWHLGYTTWEHTPTFRGFESFYGYYNCAEDYFTHSQPPHNSTWGLDFHDDKQPNCGKGCSRPAWEANLPPAKLAECMAESASASCVKPNQHPWQSGCWTCDDVDHYSTHLISNRVISVISNHVARHGSAAPFFLYLPFQDTHAPAEVPRAYRDAVNDDAATGGIPNVVRRELAGKLATVDEAFANITAALRDANMLDNTIIFYTTDNGGPIANYLGESFDGIGASNYPLRGGKHNAYEGGVRATAWVWDGRGKLHRKAGPGIPRGRTWHGLAHAVDYLPTICSIAGCNPFPHPRTGVPPRYSLALDGIDFSAELTNNATASQRTNVILDVDLPSPHNPWAKEYGYGTIRTADGWKYMVGFPENNDRKGDWSNPEPWLNVTYSLQGPAYGPEQLFNVLDDPEERHDQINNTDAVPAGVLERLRELYMIERNVAVYPFLLGPTGYPNAQGVWEPWMNSSELLVTPPFVGAAQACSGRAYGDVL
eukprot:gene6271-24392_t